MAEHYVECRSCGQEVQVEDPDDQVGDDSIIRITCSCGANLEVLYDRRRSFRLFVAIRGKFQKATSSGGILIKDLSAHGLRFDTQEPDCLAVGDKIEIEYHTSFSAGKSHIKRRAEIERVDGRDVSASYLD